MFIFKAICYGYNLQPLTYMYILEICNTYLKSDCVIRRSLICLYLPGRGSSVVVLPHSLSAVVMDVLLALYLASVFLMCWRNEWIRGSSLQKLSVIDLSFRLTLHCCNTSTVKEVSLDSVEEKNQPCDVSLCHWIHIPLHTPLMLPTGISNVCSEAKQSNQRFQMQSEWHEPDKFFSWSAAVNLFPNRWTLC